MTGDWSTKRHCHAALRFGALAALVFFVLWGIVDLLGSVPTITALGCDGDIIQLPFAYSRWLDVPSAFFFVIVFWAFHYALLIVARPAKRVIEDGLACGAILGLFCGLIAVVLISFFPAGVVIIPFLLTFVNLSLPLPEKAGNLSLLLTTSFVTGAISSLVAGVGPGLIVALITAVVSIATVTAIAVLKWLILDILGSVRFWRKVWDLLTAADINGE